MTVEEVSPSAHIDAVHTDTIERVLRHRDGVPSATGPDTTWYNLQVK